uniref:CUL7/CUL9 N-terminal domain-containing protein n=1 Tax=Fundulus heteroclitus TaxID=8078 RepID=A0A3Q2QHN8_FUNHE
AGHGLGPEPEPPRGSGPAPGGGRLLRGGARRGEPKPENVLMWMTTEDVYANCPVLLGKRKTDVELSDMKQDVKNLVCRARKQMAKKSDFSINIMHTIHVLSAYASIGSLVGVFKETGALNLLMELLCNKETQTRRSAGKMLRALASHDAGEPARLRRGHVPPGDQRGSGEGSGQTQHQPAAGHRAPGPHQRL